MTSTDKRPIGVFDSGIGGLMALRALAAMLPQENFLYLGDTARVPYGNRSPETVKRYARQCAQFLLSHSVKMIVVACSTVSAIALAELEEMSPVPVIGMIKPGVSAVLSDEKIQRIGIIGTRATIQSRAYEKEIHLQRDQADLAIFSEACPLFVPLVEEGWHESPLAYTVAETYLSTLKKEKIDALILGCTHYPLLKGTIGAIIPGVKLIDPAEEAAKQTAIRILGDIGSVMEIAQGIPIGFQGTGKAREKSSRTYMQYVSSEISAQHNQNLKGDGHIDCYVTDLAPTFVRLADQFLGVQPQSVHRVSIEEDPPAELFPLD